MQALRSIRLRLTLWYVLLLAVILAAFSAGIYLTLRHNLSANLNDSLETRTNILLDVVHFEGGRPTLAGRVRSERCPGRRSSGSPANRSGSRRGCGEALDRCLR